MQAGKKKVKILLKDFLGYRATVNHKNNLKSGEKSELTTKKNRQLV